VPETQPVRLAWALRAVLELASGATAPATGRATRREELPAVAGVAVALLELGTGELGEATERRRARLGQKLARVR
jgi:hypothetical protein